MVEIAADISRESCRYTRKLKGYARMLTVQLSDGVRVIHETARIAKQCDRFNLAGLPKMFDKHRIRLGHFFFSRHYVKRRFTWNRRRDRYLLFATLSLSDAATRRVIPRNRCIRKYGSSVSHASTKRPDRTVDARMSFVRPVRVQRTV